MYNKKNKQQPWQHNKQTWQKAALLIKTSLGKQISQTGNDGRGIKWIKQMYQGKSMAKVEIKARFVTSLSK